MLAIGAESEAGALGEPLMIESLANILAVRLNSSSLRISPSSRFHQ